MVGVGRVYNEYSAFKPIRTALLCMCVVGTIVCQKTHGLTLIYRRSSCIKPKIMKHDYGSVVQIGNALYFMALLSKSPILAPLIQYFKTHSEISHCTIRYETCGF